MFKKILRIASHLTLALSLICLMIFVGFNSVAALSQDVNGETSPKIAIVPSEENQRKDEGTNMIGGIPDLGDDQVFPFVAGLDSYEGSKR